MSHQTGQLLLLLFSVFFIFYAFRIRTVLINRLIYSAIFIIGVIFILWPDFSTSLANMIGIGRGADLILYFFIIFSLFHFVSVNKQIRNLDHKLTEFIRAYAIMHPIQGATSNDYQDQNNERKE